MDRHNQIIQIRYGGQTLRLSSYYVYLQDASQSERAEAFEAIHTDPTRSLSAASRELLEYILTSPRLLSALTIRGPHPQDTSEKLYQEQNGIIACGEITDTDHVLRLLSLLYTYLKFPEAAKKLHVDTRVELIAKGANPAGFRYDLFYRHEGNPIFVDHTCLDPSTKISIKKAQFATIDIPQPNVPLTSAKIFWNKVAQDGKLIPNRTSRDPDETSSLKAYLYEPSLSIAIRYALRCMGVQNTPPILGCFKIETPISIFSIILELAEKAFTLESKFPTESSERLKSLLDSHLKPDSLLEKGFNTEELVLQALVDPRLALLCSNFSNRSFLLFEPTNRPTMPPVEPIDPTVEPISL